MNWSSIHEDVPSISADVDMERPADQTPKFCSVDFAGAWHNNRGMPEPDSHQKHARVCCLEDRYRATDVSMVVSVHREANTSLAG